MHKTKKRSGFRPTVEQLDARVVPATMYYWRGGHDVNEWALNANWSLSATSQVTPTDYPGQNNSATAIFDGNSPDCYFKASIAHDCDLNTTDTAHGNWLNTLHLGANFTTNGSTVLQSGKIDVGPQAGGASGFDSIFSGAHNVWGSTSGGKTDFIDTSGQNASSSCGQVQVIGGTVTVEGGARDCVADIFIGPSGSGADSIMTISGMTGDITFTDNAPDITIESDGSGFRGNLNLEETGGNGDLLCNGSTTGSILVEGGTAALTRQGSGDLLADFDCLVENGGVFTMNGSNMRFVTPTNVDSLVITGMQGSPGTLIVEAPGTLQVSTDVRLGIWGNMTIITSTFSISGDLTQNGTGSTIAFNDASPCTLTVSGTVTLTAGTLSMDYDFGAGTCDELGADTAFNISSGESLELNKQNGTSTNWETILSCPSTGWTGELGSITGASFQQVTNGANEEGQVK